ncbi:MAG: pseudouridine synthase [Bacillota bacterium]
MDRLQKVMARAGIGSRRFCEQLIAAGKVSVNGVVVTVPGTQVGPADRVAVEGAPLGKRPGLAYYVLNKPRGYLSTARDPAGRPSVLDLVPRGRRLYPVGRLDRDSEGLILLTNDGELANALTHPSFEVEKEYHVSVRGKPDPGQLKRLSAGVRLVEGTTAPAGVALLGQAGGQALLSVVIAEGKRRQVRRMLAAVGLETVSLKRVRLGPLTLGQLRRGQCRLLTEGEVAELYAAAARVR